MKYKAGDKIKIKTWEAMKEEFGIYDPHHIRTHFSFTDLMEEMLCDDFPNRIFTIEAVVERHDNEGDYYRLNGPSFYWGDDMIECKVDESSTLFYESTDRFKLMDFE